MIPGEYFLADGNIRCNDDRSTVVLTVINTGDRPVQVGSHFHFFEVNRQMQFDRQAAYGMRLNIPAGTAVRFEPGEEKDITLVAFGGNRIIHGFSRLVEGQLDDPSIKEQALQKLADGSFKNTSK